MPLTVLEIFCNPAFSSASVLSGWKHLSRAVTSVTVAEVPDAASWLLGGELVLSTAYLFREDTDQLLAWIRSLGDAGAACVGVKAQRFVGHIPQRVLAEANSLGLPIIALPYTLSWPTIIRPVTQALMLAEAAQQESYVGPLLELLSGRAGFPSLAQVLSDLVGNPVAIFTLDGKPYGIGLPSRHRVAAEMTKLWVEQWHRLPKVPSIDWQVSEGSVAWARRRVNLNGAEAYEQLYPLPGPVGLHGYVSVLEVDPQPADLRVNKILEFYAGAASRCFDHLLLVQERPVSERRARLRESLAGPEPTSPGGDTDLRLGLEGMGVVAVLQTVARASVTVVERDGGSEVSDPLLESVEEWATRREPVGFVTAVDAAIVVLLPIHEGPGAVAYQRQMVAELVSTAEYAGGGCSVHAGIGEPGTGVVELRRSYHQARHALEIGLAAVSDQRVWYFGELGIDRVLAGLRGSALARDFSTRVVGALRQPPDRNSTLLETVEAYVTANCDLRATAARLYIHPNTLRYRLQQVEKVTGLHLDRFEDLVQLYLALRLAAAGTIFPYS